MATLNVLREVGPQHGQGAVSAQGSGRACPTAVIALCPMVIVRRLRSSFRGLRPPHSLLHLALLALWTLLGWAYIPVSGHSLPVLLVLAPLGHTGFGVLGSLGRWGGGGRCKP